MCDLCKTGRVTSGGEGGGGWFMSWVYGSRINKTPDVFDFLVSSLQKASPSLTGLTVRFMIA